MKKGKLQHEQILQFLDDIEDRFTEVYRDKLMEEK